MVILLLLKTIVIPVALVVVCVMSVNAVLIHNVGVVDARLTVLLE